MAKKKKKSNVKVQAMAAAIAGSAGPCGLPRCNCVDGVCGDVHDKDEEGDDLQQDRRHSCNIAPPPRSSSSSASSASASSSSSAIPNCTQQLCEILEVCKKRKTFPFLIQSGITGIVARARSDLAQSVIGLDPIVHGGA
jgi:hypothetical protein